MLKRITRVLSFTLGLLILQLLLASPSSASPTETSYTLKTLQDLFVSFKRQAAYDYASQYLTEMEGDPYFDYYYGVSAIDTGHASEGVFALERVLLVFPNDPVARLELARGYFILQEYALSREAFESVLETSPPSQVRDTAEAYLDRIRVSESRYRPTHSGYLSFSLGHDDNVNAGIDENAEIEILSLLSTESLGQDDNFSRLHGSWTYARPFSPGWYFESVVSGDFRKNQDLDIYDTATATLQLGIVHLEGNHKIRTHLVTQQFNLDSDKYRTLNNLTLDWQYTINQQSSLTTIFQYATLDYPDLSNRNSDLTTLGLSYLHSFSAYLQPVFFTSLSLSQEAAEEDTTEALADTERDIYSLRAGLILSLSNTLALQTSLGLQVSEYAGAPLFDPDEIREDDYTTAELGLLWSFKRKWRLDSRFTHTKNESTFELRDYERNAFEVSVNYSF